MRPAAVDVEHSGKRYLKEFGRQLSRRIRCGLFDEQIGSCRQMLELLSGVCVCVVVDGGWVGRWNYAKFQCEPVKAHLHVKK